MRTVRTTLVLLVLALGVPAGARAAVRDPAAASVASPALAEPVPCVGCWRPRLRLSWQWQLRKPPRARALLPVQVYDVDGFDASRRLVRAMHDQSTKAVCYISAGSWETWRPDADDFSRVLLGRTNGWPGERWLDIRRLGLLRPLLKARVARCARKGFDGIEYDNVDGYQNRTGFPLTGDDQLRYNVVLANLAHRRGLAVVLKNDLGQIGPLLPYFDAALNEQCFQYAECGRLTPFVEAGKPVFGVEYRLAASEFCSRANALDFNFLKKERSLGAWRVPCRAE